MDFKEGDIVRIVHSGIPSKQEPASYIGQRGAFQGYHPVGYARVRLIPSHDLILVHPESLQKEE